VSHGVWFDGSSVEGFARVAERRYVFGARSGDLLPLCRGEWIFSTARVICDVYTPDGEPFTTAFCLKTTVGTGSQHGLIIRLAPNCEIFFLFERQLTAA